MKITKVFKCGNSQAVRLPREFQFKNAEVEISRQGNSIVLREKPKKLKRAFELLASMPKDFFKDGDREDSIPEERDVF